MRWACLSSSWYRVGLWFCSMLGWVELADRKGSNEKYRLLVRADKECHAKYVSKALEWGAEAGIDNIAFSGLNHEE